VAEELLEIAAVDLVLVEAVAAHGQGLIVLLACHYQRDLDGWVVAGVPEVLVDAIEVEGLGLREVLGHGQEGGKPQAFVDPVDVHVGDVVERLQSVDLTAFVAVGLACLFRLGQHQERPPIWHLQVHLTRRVWSHIAWALSHVAERRRSRDKDLAHALLASLRS